MTDVLGRFFCHECNVEKDRVTQDFTCTTCQSGFIEEMSAASQADEDEEADFLPHRHRGAGLEAVLPSLLSLAAADDWQGPMQGSSRMPRGARFTMHSDGPLRPLRPGTGATPAFPSHDRNFENFIQELIMNVTGMGVAGGGMGGATGGVRAGPGGNNLSFHFLPMGGLDPGLQIHGNPGDYAWGRGGLDTIITQLLNQMEGAGPPPMTKENISEIPTVMVTQELLDKNPNCSVCWEDFKLEEPVMKLECNHCFHKDCIVPWLELHGTCPVCRKVLTEDSSGGGNRHTDHQSQEPDQFLDTDPSDSGLSSSGTTGQNEGSNNSSSGNSSTSGGSSSSSQQQASNAAAPTSLSGFLQSTLGSILGVNLGSPTGHTGGEYSFSSNNPTSPTSQNSSTSASGTTIPGSARRLPPSSSASGETEDVAPPASRRQRLDSDFVDFDLE